jgi:hypothetical protein
MLALRKQCARSATVNHSEILACADDFQLLHRELALSARTQALRRANAKAAGMVRKMDKAATLAVLNRLRRY